MLSRLTLSNDFLNKSKKLRYLAKVQRFVVCHKLMFFIYYFIHSPDAFPDYFPAKHLKLWRKFRQLTMSCSKYVYLVNFMHFIWSNNIEEYLWSFKRQLDISHRPKVIKCNVCQDFWQSVEIVLWCRKLQLSLWATWPLRFIWKAKVRNIYTPQRIYTFIAHSLLSSTP